MTKIRLTNRKYVNIVHTNKVGLILILNFSTDKLINE